MSSTSAHKHDLLLDGTTLLHFGGTRTLVLVFLVPHMLGVYGVHVGSSGVWTQLLRRGFNHYSHGAARIVAAAEAPVHTHISPVGSRLAAPPFFVSCVCTSASSTHWLRPLLQPSCCCLRLPSYHGNSRVQSGTVSLVTVKQQFFGDEPHPAVRQQLVAMVTESSGQTSCLQPRLSQKGNGAAECDHPNDNDNDL